MINYELTVTLKPYMYNRSAFLQFDETYPKLKIVLRGFKATCVAELTLTHNIHYHCIVELPIVDTIISKEIIINRLRNYRCFGKIQFIPVQFEDSYKEYLFKCIEDTKQVGIKDPIVLDQYNLSRIELFEDDLINIENYDNIDPEYLNHLS